MEIKMKGKAIIGIAIIVAVLASAVGVVSAADESVVEFEDQGYTVRITFPNGEGIAYNGSKNMWLDYRDSRKTNVNLINVRGWDAYTPINISIKIEGISDKDWWLSRWNSFYSWPRYKPVYVDERTKRFEVQCADHRYSHLTQCRVYKINNWNIYFTLVLQGEDCNTYCKNLLDHGIWDGESEYPNCACICEKGWEMTKDVLCVACDDICKEKGKHYIYDPENSYKNDCECKCEDGYEHSFNTDKCEKVECPPNSTNVADLAGSCPKDRKLNRHCCCNESYIRSWGTCVREDSGEEDYYVKPVVHEITVGEKIEFSLVKIKHGRYTTVSNDKIVWVVANEKSISEFIGKITIGTINSNGVFIAKNIGTCFVRAIIDEKIKSEFKIAVKCSENVDGDLNKIVSLYKSRIPEGPFHKDLRDGKISPPFKYMNPGYATNLLARKDPIYEEFVCGGCQGDALKFLHNIQANSSECTLLNGYEFGPIEGSYGGHHAVVIYPKGTDWKKTGLVLDSWYHQKPEQFSIDVWKEVFHPIAGDTSSSYRLEYPTTKDPHDYDYAFWTVAEAFVKDIRGVFFCPVNILITDNEGRRLGVLDDGSMAFEIPNASIMNLPNDAGNNNWYFELDSDVSSNYNLEIIGTDEGTFELLIANKKDKSIKYYGKQPITQGEKAEIVLDSSNPEAPLILQDGTEVQPTSIEKSKRDNYNHILAQSAVQKVLIGQNLQFEGFNRTPVTVSRIVSGDIENIYQADANNSIHNLNWQTSGAFYVNYVTGTPATYDAQLSVEEPDMPLELKVGTKEVSAIAAGTNLIIDTRGMNLFPEDQVDLVVIGPDGQIKHDDVNDQQFTNITVDYLTSNYGDSDNTLETAGWGIGAYIFWVKTDSEYACGLDAESDVKPLKILRGSITIKAETASTVERETVKLTVMGVADDTIRVESSPLSDNVLFKESIDDTPTGANYHVNWFNDAIDEDGIRRYAVEFSNTGIYTIKVTVASGDREGDSDTVEITVSEKEVAFDLPYTVVIGDKIHIKGTATSGTYVSVYVEDTLYRKLVNIVIEDGEFRQEVKTTDIGMDVPGIVNLKAWIDCDKYAGEERPTRSPDGEDAILLTTPTLMTAELSVPAVALEDDFSVIGTAKGQTEVTILSVPPRGGGGKSLLDKGQKGVSPRKASVSMTDGTFAKKMTVQEDADSGVYYIIVLSSGMDGVWGMTGQEHLEAALDEKYHIPSLTYGIICTKTQEQVIAILDDLTQTPGSDDLMQKLTLKVGDIDSLTLNPIADVVVGDPLVVTGETSRKDGSIIWLTVKKLYYEIVPQAAIATDKTFSATFDRTGAPPGTYTVRAYDEYGYTVATKVNIIAETPAS